MKTKHILTALALPAMFAACTADDIVSENNGLQQDQRAKLSKDLVLNINSEVESRYAVEGTTSLKFTFEEGDKIGANLIDIYGGDNFDPEDPATWTITQTVAPALPFVYEGGVWKSAGELGVGNYLFTNPYNPDDKNRAAAKYELPVVVQYDSENPVAHIEKYNKAVAHVILREGETEAKVDLKNLFTYPKIVADFSAYNGISKIEKVILKKDNGMITKGALDHTAIVTAFKPETIKAAINQYKDDAIVDEESYWAQVSTSQFVIDTEAEISAAKNGRYANIETSQYFIYEMNEPLVNGTFEIRLMLPSIDNLTTVEDSADEIWMYFVTDKGNFKFELTDDASYAWGSATTAPKKAGAFARNKSNTLRVKKFSAAADTEIEEFESNIVSNEEDWNALVAKYGDLEKYSAAYLKKHTTEKPLVVKIINSGFALNADLDMPNVAEFVIQSDVNVEGEVTLKNIKIQDPVLTDTEVPTIIVKEGATLTTTQTLIAPVVEVEEGGNLVFAAAYDKEEKLVAYEDVTKVCNHGTVTVPAGVIAQFDLDNAKGAVLNVGAAASRAAEVAVANIYGVNNGIINNNGEINVVGEVDDVVKTFVNKTPSDDATTGNGYEWNIEKEAWDGVPTINNLGTFNAKGATTNNGLFVNSGVLSSNFTGESIFYNTTVANTDADKTYTAILDVRKNAKTYIDANSDEDGGNAGKIVLAEATPANFVIHNAKEVEDYNNDYCGTIEFTMNDKSATEISLKNSPVNYLITNVGIDLTNTYTYKNDKDEDVVVALPTLEVNGGEVKIAATTKNADEEDVPVALVDEMIIKSGDVLVAGTVNSVTSITVYADAALGIPASAELSVSTLNNIELKEKAGEEKADAKLMINGVLNLRDVNGDADGLMTDSDKAKLSENITLHKNAKITCKVVADVVAETTYEKNDKLYNVLKVLVDAYLENSAEIKEDYENNGQDTWAEITADDVEWSIETEYRDGATWAKKAVTDFVTAYNALWDDDAVIAATDVIRKDAVKYWTATWSESWRTIVGSYNGTYDGYKASATDKKESKASVLKAVYTNAITAASLKTEIKTVMGNKWVGTTVYVKEFDTQAITDIKSADGNTVMTAAYKTAVSGALDNEDLVAEMSNIGYLTWKKFINKELDDATAEFAYETEIVKSDYIDASSYIEFWEGSDLYKDMKLWKDLSDKYSGTVLGNSTTFVKYAANNLTMKNMYDAFAAVYVAAQADGADPLFKIDPLVTQITTDKLSATEALKWTNEQLEKMAEVDGKLVDLEVEVEQTED